ncbi:NUDIX hydrolase [Prauserella marina]|uniref:8-oxo-dGTP diphosphatase n=1 Tax=Prauserella marina TaxID=530584 RepID=A0A222VLS4_9PSEU|nr:NUDIX hydrolase [Prauserella marina]ASR34671.1 NUDIX hydrolase [Prauserella marina]PWV85676.1 8-oxo-dGTP diphosphatase [Prauserella marina]SDC48692.1 8-oxo-dGTP diphosphatase [Prauserella marina]
MSGTERPVIRAAGAVLWRRNPATEKLEVAVVHRNRYDDWSLPKGKLDQGETAPVAAVRELAEETGFDAVLGRFLTRVEYSVGEAAKTVDYFSARALGGLFAANEEVDELRWCSPELAVPMVGYDGDRAVLRQFMALPADLTTVLLVRHAKAGKRESWAGADDLRPLSEAGRRQAAALRVLLGTFGPDRVFAAPKLRCVQTVLGVADDLDRTVTTEPVFAEESFSSAPSATVARLLRIAAEGGTPVVCSQGGVIPALVRTLAERGGVGGVALPTGGTGSLASKKGSLWLLSFAADGDTPSLVAASYLPSPLPAPSPSVR